MGGGRVYRVGKGRGRWTDGGGGGDRGQVYGIREVGSWSRG